MPRNKRKHPHTRYERIMLACIDSLPFKFHSPGQPNMGGDNQQNRRVTKEEQRAFKRIDTPVREHATDKRYRGTTRLDVHGPKNAEGKFTKGLRQTGAAPPKKVSMN